MEKLTEMGFKPTEIYKALLTNKFSYQETFDFLSKNSTQKNNEKKNEKKIEEISTINDDYSPKSFIEKIFAISPNFTERNFFVQAIVYLEERFSNYTGYCIICSRKHSCISDHPGTYFFILFLFL